MSQFLQRINHKSFGFNTDQKEVLCYTLCNVNGMEISIINYGATITSLKVPIKNNQLIDVVLGFDTLEDYMKSFQIEGSPYFGAVIGRYAGRISNANFPLNGKQIVLHKNHGNHTLHGGFKSFSTAFWDVKSITNRPSPSITLTYTSLNHEENFPGELTVEVTYTLTEENEVKIVYKAHSTEDTIINLTQHSYFNLEGQKASVLNQMLEINSDKILEVDSENIPTGQILPIENTSFDFTSPKNCPEKIDTSFILKDNNIFSASLFSKLNQLKMLVYTNQPSVHIYVGGSCSGLLTGKENTVYHTTSGICFETQNFPDAPNQPHFPNAILKKDEKYHQETIFKFENT